MHTLYKEIEPFYAVAPEGHYQERMKEARFIYFVSEIMRNLQIEDTAEINISLSRVFQAYDALKISIPLHFRKVFRFDGETLLIDWKISSLACYMIVINCNPINAAVAKAQLYYAAKQF